MSEHRYLLAGRLMRPQATTPEEARERLRQMPRREVDRLRALVDWVQAYEREEQPTQEEHEVSEN